MLTGLQTLENLPSERDTPAITISVVKPPEIVGSSAVRLASITNKVYIKPPIRVMGTNDAMQYIFQHESGNRLNAVNSIGCVGLGQSCGGGLEAYCSNWRIDSVCQINYFTNYANNRYGGWTNAQLFWQNHRWW